jgi:hypothetical protein
MIFEIKDWVVRVTEFSSLPLLNKNDVSRVSYVVS